MGDFKYYAPTKLIFGENCLANNACLFSDVGRKMFIITAHFADTIENTALKDLINVCSTSNIDYEVYDDSEENPSVEFVVKVTEAMNKYNPDFIVAIGGGSAIDTAKASNVLANFPEDTNAYTAFFGSSDEFSKIGGKYPMFAIPTTAGSGSEVMGYSILTRTDTDTKLRIHQLCFYNAAFYDIRYIAHSPLWLLDNGAMDTLAHGIEGCLNTFCTEPIRVLHNYGFELFRQYKEKLFNNTLEHDDLKRMFMASAMQGIAVIQSGTSIPHGLGYSLSHFKGMPHGLASVITVPAYLDSFEDKTLPNHVLEACGFEDIQSFRKYIDAIVWRNFNCSITLNEINAWAKECLSLNVRMKRHPESMNFEKLRTILLSTFESHIV